MRRAAGRDPRRPARLEGGAGVACAGRDLRCAGGGLRARARALDHPQPGHLQGPGAGLHQRLRAARGSQQPPHLLHR